MSRLSEVQKKYTQIDWNIAKTYDPSKNNKYLNWIGINIEFGDGLKDLIQNFEKRVKSLKHSDINKYTAKELKKELDSLDPTRSEQKEGAELIYDADGWKVYFLQTHMAAKYYSAGTKWCISSPGTFYEICVDDNIYVVIKNGVKFALTSNTNSYDYNYDFLLYDETDNKNNDQEPYDAKNYFSPSPYISKLLNNKDLVKEFNDLSESSKKMFKAINKFDNKTENIYRERDQGGNDDLDSAIKYFNLFKCNKIGELFRFNGGVNSGFMYDDYTSAAYFFDTCFEKRNNKKYKTIIDTFLKDDTKYVLFIEDEEKDKKFTLKEYFEYKKNPPKPPKKSLDERIEDAGGLKKAMKNAKLRKEILALEKE